MVTIKTQYKSKINSEEEEETPRLSPLDYLNFYSKDINWNDLNIDLSRDLQTLRYKSPDEMLEATYKVILEVSEKYVPLRKYPVTQKAKNRYIREKENLRRRKRRINQQICNAKSSAKKERLFKRLVDEEVKLQKLAKKTNIFHENKAINAIQENTKYFFSYAKRKNKVKIKIGPLLNKKTEQMTTNSIEMADILADQYCSAFSIPSTEPPIIDENTLPIQFCP